MKKILSVALLSIFLSSGFAATVSALENNGPLTELTEKDKDKDKKKKCKKDKACCKKGEEKACCKKGEKKDCKKGEEAPKEESAE